MPRYVHIENSLPCLNYRKGVESWSFGRGEDMVMPLGWHAQDKFDEGDCSRIKRVRWMKCGRLNDLNPM